MNLKSTDLIKNLFRLRVKASIPLLLICLVFPAQLLADVIYTQTGGTLKGLVVEEHWDRIVLSTEGGEKTISRETIDEVFYDDPERNQLYLGNQALELKQFSLARGFFKKALQFNPDFQEAEDALNRLSDLELKAKSFTLEATPLEALELQLGLTLATSNLFVLVEQVVPGSSGGAAGLLPGDALIGYWGESLAYLSPEEVAERLIGAQDTPVKLTLERQVMLPSALPGERDWPAMTLGMERLGLTILEVTPKGMVDLTGLKVSDRITQIDDASTRYMPLSKVRQLLKKSRKKGIQLKIHRDILVKR